MVDSDVLPDQPAGFAYDRWDPIQHFEAAMRLLADHDILGIHAVYVSSLTNVVAKAIKNHVPNLSWPIVVKPSVLLEGGLNHDIIHSVVTWLRNTLLDHNHQEPFSDSLLLIVGRVTFIAGDTLKSWAISLMILLKERLTRMKFS